MKESSGTPFPHIPGYTITELLYAGSRTLVYRALQQPQQQPVTLKILQRSHPTFNEIVQFRNQYAIARNLDFPGILHPLALESWQNSYALVLEDDGSISLAQYSQQHPLNGCKILAIAVQLAEILHDLHARRVIHKDIKPTNILIHPESERIKLIDFSISSLLPRETQEIQNPNILEGTLAYIPPEQTGRMNRGIDYRADFYSLGVTLYELLTGQLPFSSEDPLELVHCHIARTPVPPHHLNSKIPPIVSAIVLKLMAKNAEDRYQNALGLKHDLERCLSEWQATGEIAEFELGATDWCDRFIIPEKLYGRQKEVAQLLAAFDRVSGGRGDGETGGRGEQPSILNSELLLVAGYSGIGKTAVINEVHTPITEKKGYFIKGKFDQFNRDVPLSAFIQAFRDLMGQLLGESDTQLGVWRERILEAVGENGQILIEVIPELESIVGQQPPVDELSGTAAQIRFDRTLKNFTAIFARAEHPLVMFLDDLQWADSASLQWLRLLMEERQALLILGAYRDNEVSVAHPLMLTVADLKEAGKNIETIVLKPLGLEETDLLVADTLSCRLLLARPLSQLLHRKTGGNPFYLTQFFKSLYQEGQIVFVPPALETTNWGWQCQLAEIEVRSLAESALDFTIGCLQKLPEATQQILSLAACLGYQFDLAALTIVAEREEADVAATLWSALQGELIVPQGQTYKFYTSETESSLPSEIREKIRYQFIHDRVQQAAYTLIPEAERDRIHLKIGRLLQESLSERDREERLFEIIGHFNRARSLITEAAQRETLAKLNLKAGQKAMISAAYAAASHYFEVGIELAGETVWEEQYELAVRLYAGAAGTAYYRGDLKAVERFAVPVFERARSAVDKVEAYWSYIITLLAQHRLLEAFNIGRQFLSELGVEIPAEPSEAEIGCAIFAVGERLGDRQIEDLLRLPTMTEPRIEAALRMMPVLFAMTSEAVPAVAPIIASTMVSLSMEFGNSENSAFGYVAYGTILCAGMGDVASGYRYGRLAVALVEQLNYKLTRSAVFFVFAGSLQHRQDHLKAMLISLKKSYLAGLETGDLLSASYSVFLNGLTSFLCGLELAELELETLPYLEALKQSNQQRAIDQLIPVLQTIENFQQEVERPDILTGKFCDENSIIAGYEQSRFFTALLAIYTLKVVLAYWFGRYEAALEHCQKAEPFAAPTLGAITIPIFHFYAALTELALYEERSSAEREATLERVAAHQAVLEQWAQTAPMNYSHKCHLVEAERCRVIGQKMDAVDSYDRAIASAKENEYVQEEALANELAAKFYLHWDKELIAAAHLQKAYYGCTRWGAKGKIADLERRYADLLAPILRPQTSSLNPLETLASLTSSGVSLNSVTVTHSGTSSSMNNALDLTAIIKASQSVSGTLNLEELLAQLIRIILHHSGASRCALLLPDANETWQVEAQATSDRTLLEAEPLEGNPHFPTQLIYYVKNTREALSLETLQEKLPSGDPYLLTYQPKSVLVLPILNQGQLTALLYLENQQAADAFTRERQLILNFLCTQAAISLENARLYRQAQDYARQLEQSQLQLIQSEKMASLGNLMAGVAHEINNPLGFLNGSIANAKTFTADLLQHLDLYRQGYPQPLDFIEENAEEIDLEFIEEDFPKILTSMQAAVNRMKGISVSLRNFSRADSDRKIKANLHEGLESTLLILKYRLKENENRPAITVVKDYGDLPEVDCFPSQLNQVFVNLLANAIDMFDERTVSQAELKANSPQISIRTRDRGEFVRIEIEDNGAGIEESALAKIFEPSFTTKDIGKGTGLGLAISRQIVVEKHGGTLECYSQLGRGSRFEILIPLGERIGDRGSLKTEDGGIGG